jgi:hypothetical protein
MINIDKLKPTTFLNLSRRDLPYCGDLSKPFFACIGCSHTAGISVNYKDSWPNQLATMFNMEHINLGFEGSDLSYQSEKIDQLFDLLPQLEFCIWMQTYPTRSRKSLKLLGDTNRRIIVNSIWEDKKTLQSLLEHTKQHVSNKKILILNTWHYPNKYIKILNAKFRNTNNYWINNNTITDYGFDGAHSGPITQKKLATDLYEYIVNNNMFGK